MGATTRHIIPVWPKRDIPEHHFVNRDIPEHYFVIPVYQFCDFEILGPTFEKFEIFKWKFFIID